jgi:tetratricopeptide (TPR) repeat protein
MIDDAIAQQLRCAQEQLRISEFENAGRICEAILEGSPNCLPALRILAHCATQLDMLDVAGASFRACAVIDPEDELAHVGLAICADCEGDPETAAVEFRRALELAPNDPGLAQEVIRREGDIITTPLMEARNALFFGNPERALTILNEWGPCGDIVADLTRARALWELGRLDDVWDLCWQISKESPTCIRALYWLRAAGQMIEKPLYVRMIKRLLEQIAPGLEPYTECLTVAPGLQLTS